MLKLDLKNFTCPLPVLKTKRFLSSLASGEQVKITSTDPASLIDLQDFCKKTGHKLIDQTQNDGVITTIIEHR